jgi:hypothetical protein
MEIIQENLGSSSPAPVQGDWLFDVMHASEGDVTPPSYRWPDTTSLPPFNVTSASSFTTLSPGLFVAAGCGIYSTLK